MPNTFKYHIRKLFTKKQKKPISTNIQPSLHFQLLPFLSRSTG